MVGGIFVRMVVTVLVILLSIRASVIFLHSVKNALKDVSVFNSMYFEAANAIKQISAWSFIGSSLK